MGTRPVVVSLFCGGGGSALGYRMAGFREALGVDFDIHACKIFAANFPNVPIWQADISKVSGADILQRCELSIGELDILDGSPPCQGFSIAGKRQPGDARNGMVSHFTRLVGEIKPRVFVIENVPAMCQGRTRSLFHEVMVVLRGHGYTVSSRIMNAANYGVAQSRRRLIILGIQEDFRKEPVFPAPGRNIKTVREVISNLPIPENSEAVWLRLGEKRLAERLPKGKYGNYVTGNSYFTHARLLWDRPSPTITAKAQLYHPDLDRYLTIREVKALSSFPQDFCMEGSFRKQWKILGNSVPPLLIKAIAGSLKKTLETTDG